MPIHASPKRPTQQGFIALISVLIICSVLLVTVFSLAQFGVASRYFLLDMENKTRSERLAEGCIHVARIAVYNDPTINESDLSNTTIPIEDNSCVITSIQPDTPSSGKSTITTHAQSGMAETTYTVVVSASTGDFESWTEEN